MNFFGFQPHNNVVPYALLICHYFMNPQVELLFQLFHGLRCYLSSFWSSLTYNSMNFLLLFLDVQYCWFINFELMTISIVTLAWMKPTEHTLSPQDRTISLHKETLGSTSALFLGTTLFFNFAKILIPVWLTYGVIISFTCII